MVLLFSLEVHMKRLFSKISFVTVLCIVLTSSAVDNALQDRLHQAIINNSIDDIKQVIQEGANCNCLKDNKSPLFWAIVLKRPEIVETLLNCGAKADKEFIQYAIKVGDFYSAFLISKNLAVDLDVLYENATLLSHALNWADYKLVLLLLRNGAYFENDKVHFKGISGNVETSVILAIYQELINRGYPVNNFWYEWPWSHWWTDKPEVIDFLICNGANLNYSYESNKFIQTPLFLAISRRDVNSVKCLLRHGVNVNQQASSVWYYDETINNTTHKLQTPLAYAIDTGCTDIIQLLLEGGTSL